MQTKPTTRRILPILVLLLFFSSCESESERNTRIAREKIEHEQAVQAQQLRKKEEQARLEKQRIEQARLERERLIEEERLKAEQRLREEIELKYGTNKLWTGATPYSICYGSNERCEDWGCSEIKVRTPSNSDVIVTLKKGGDVVRHAYILANSSYTFHVPNGTYQPFFYYGLGWNPTKEMPSQCSNLKGGFIKNENFGKDDPQVLTNNILEYELILQSNGNFSTRPSNAAEAL